MRNSNPNNQEAKEPETAEEYLEYAQDLLGDTPRESRTSAPAGSGDLSYTDEVNKLIKEVTVGEDGKFVYPDNTPEHLKYAVAAEKKYRDTQSSYTKAQQSLKESDGENVALRNQLSTASTTELKLSEDDQERLDDLMHTNPTEWRREMNELETAHTASVQKSLEESMGKVRGEAGAKFELDRRIGVLAEFNERRVQSVGNDNKPLTAITVEMLDDDIPPRITKRLAEGHLTFEGYLSEVEEYLGKGKVVSNPAGSNNGTKLNSGAGGHNPPAESADLENGALDYASMTL